MKKRLTSVVVAGTIAVGGLGAGLLAVPVIASAATVETTEEGSVTEAVGDRLSQIRAALDGLVSDGTLDEAQADAVASTLDEALPQRGPGGHGGPGGGRGGLALDEAAGLLGLTADELRTELQEGQSLAAVAEAQGVALETLVDGLVTAAQERLAERVSSGDITQEQADERLADLQERTTALVQSEDLPLRGGHGDRGTRDGATDGTGETEAPSDDATAETTSLTA